MSDFVENVMADAGSVLPEDELHFIHYLPAKLAVYSEKNGVFHFLTSSYSLNKFLTGSEDVTASNGTYGDVQAQLLREVGCKDVTSIVYPGMRHSILQEPGWLQVCSDVISWLDKRYPL